MKPLQFASAILRNACVPAAVILLSAAAPLSMAQSQSQSQSQTQGSQAASQPATAGQTDSADKPQSLGDVARANAQKDKPKAKHVITDDNLSSVGGTISVVGDSSSSGASGGGNSNGGQSSASSASKDEAYWRGRAQAIKDQIAEVDKQIDAKKDEIAKAGPTSFDPQTGLSQNVIIVHDRNAELKDLEDRKARLEQQLDDLADEGRKDGADSGWFR